MPYSFLIFLFSAGVKPILTPVPSKNVFINFAKSTDEPCFEPNSRYLKVPPFSIFLPAKGCFLPSLVYHFLLPNLILFILTHFL